MMGRMTDCAVPTYLIYKFPHTQGSPRVLTRAASAGHILNIGITK